MKEIKYRAWDNVEMKMYYTGEESDIHFYFDSSGIVADRYFDSMVYTPEGDSYPTGDYERLEHLVYMQYTGLKDKNGVEIYDGDIVRISYMNPLIGKIAEDFYKIETQDSSLVKMIHSSGEERWHRYLYLQYKEVEIIGNVYENPDWNSKN